MCPPPDGHDLYFYYVADNYKRISDDWNTFEYAFFALLISLIIFIWCDIASEDNQRCARSRSTRNAAPCVNRSRCESTRNAAPCVNRSVCDSETCLPKRRVTVCPPSTSCTNISKTTINNINKIRKQECSLLYTARSRSKSPPPPPQPLRRSLRIRNNLSLYDSNSNVSMLPAEQEYCNYWCQRREHRRCREEARKKRRLEQSRSRSRSRR